LEVRLITECGARHATKTTPRRNRFGGSQAPLLSRMNEGRTKHTSLDVLVVQSEIRGHLRDLRFCISFRARTRTRIRLHSELRRDKLGRTGVRAV
jgi:hypothetical protein